MKYARIIARDVKIKLQDEKKKKKYRNSKGEKQNLYNKYKEKNTSLFSNEKGEEIDLEESKHLFHPSSKLIFKSKKLTEGLSGNFEYKLDEKKEAKRIKEELSFKLEISNNKKKLKEPNNFKKFYSGGPIKPRNFLILKQTDFFDYPDDAIISQNWIDNKIQYQAAVKIQKVIRGIIERKKYRKTIKDLRNLRKAFINQKVKKFKKENLFLMKLKNTVSINEDSDLKVKSENETSIKKKIKEIRISHSRNSSLFTGLTPTRLFSSGKLFKSPPKYIPTQSRKSLSPSVNLNIKDKGENLLKKKNNQEKRNKIVNFSSEKRDIFRLLLKKRVKNQKQIQPKHRQLINYIKCNNINGFLKSGYMYDANDVNILDEKRNSPLYYAAKVGNEKFCEVLLKRGANPNLICSDGDTPFHMAFSSAKSIVKILN